MLHARGERYGCVERNEKRKHIKINERIGEKKRRGEERRKEKRSVT